MKVEPGLCSVTLRSLAPEAVIDLAAAAGLAAIEWGGDVHVPPGSPDAFRIGERTRAAGLTVSSYGSYCVAPDSPLDDCRRAIETASALGAPHFRIWPGTRGRASSSYDAAERARVADAIAAIADAAAEADLSVGLEFHPGSLTDEAGSARALVEAVARPNVFLYWQPAPGIGLADALAELDFVSDDVGHLHVFAWDAERNRYPLADHAAFWPPVFAALKPGRWPGRRFAMLEFVRGDDPGQLLADAVTLRRWLSERDASAPC